MNKLQRYDYLVVGAGIGGILATLLLAKKFPEKKSAYLILQKPQGGFYPPLVFLV